jgi:hypothetical protein
VSAVDAGAASAATTGAASAATTGAAVFVFAHPPTSNRAQNGTGDLM